MVMEVAIIFSNGQKFLNAFQMKVNKAVRNFFKKLRKILMNSLNTNGSLFGFIGVQAISQLLKLIVQTIA